jgi:hypothetical protein
MKINKILFFVITTLIAVSIAVVLDFNDPKFNWHDIIVEYHGLVLDLFVLGIVLTIYETLKQKKDSISEYHSKIDDIRSWDSKEATHKIVSYVNRLYDLGVTEFNLMNCYLKLGNLQEFNFSKSNFYNANLYGANFLRSNLSYCKLGLADLSESGLNGTNFYSADLYYAILNSASIINCKFSNANLDHANLQNARIINTEFTNAKMTYCYLENTKVYDFYWFEYLKSCNVEGIEWLTKNYYVDSKSLDRDEIGEFWTISKKSSL